MDNRDLPDQCADSEATNGLEIAIIGMAGRFPGSQDIGEFWQNLSDGVEGVRTFTEAEMLAAGISPKELAHPHYVRRGGALAGIELFDAGFFGIYPREADIMDPQQRIFLETAWEALEHAGYNPENYAGAIGLFGGMSMNTYLLLNLAANRAIRETVHGYQLTIANDKDYLPTRVSYKFNLRGPSVNVQTACSTSLVATHLACQSLLNYQCDMALAGGVSVRVPQHAGYLYQEGGIASPDGYCRAFDAQAAGTVSGNGVGVVVLKRLADALADGDTIHAVVKATAINNDGSAKVGYTAPSVEGQAEVIAMAQTLADVTPDSINYIEAHGTGTALGDPIEIAALTEVWRSRCNTERRQYCAIGSVKTNVGHLDAAAGVVSLIKTALALEHRQIPPSLHYTAPNPNIDFAHSPFFVNTQLRAWQPAQPGTPRRAGVSSFGIGGTNVHAILEEAPAAKPSGPSRPWQLLLLSARSETALQAATTRLAQHLGRAERGVGSTVEDRATKRQHDLADVAYTLQVGRKAFEQRRMLVCRNVDDALVALTQHPERLLSSHVQSAHQAVVFMFSGQGAQYASMGCGLYEQEPVFRTHVDHCCELLRPQLGLDLRTLLFPAPADVDAATERLKQTAITQPALFVIEYALAQLWMSWGIQPEAMIGHSIGEYVAACLAGVFSLEDALTLVATRGRLMQSLPAGAMLSVAMAETDLRPILQDYPDLALAAINGPALCVVAGPFASVDALERQLTASGASCRHLHTSHAFHSAMMDPILPAFTAAVSQVKLAAPALPFISNITGQWITPSEATDPAYWTRHLRQTVRFADGIAALAQDPARIFLEVGPGRTLASLAKSHPALGPSRVVVSSMRHPQSGDQDDQAFLLSALGQLWLAGFTPDWRGFYANEQRRRVPLPTYPFERQRHWIDPDTDFGPQQVTRHTPATIAKRSDMTTWFYAPTWRRAALHPAFGDASPTGPWLVFANDDALSAAVVQALRATGGRVVVVWAGDQLRRSKTDPDLFTIAPEQASDYRALAQELHARQLMPHRVVHLWAARTKDSDGNTTARFQRAQMLGFSSLVYLAQALPVQPLHIDVITAGVHEVIGAEEIWPERATLVGACRVLPQEYSQITCRCIDVPSFGGLAETHKFATGEKSNHLLAHQVTAELLAPPTDSMVAYRGGHRWVQTYEALPIAPDASATAPLRHQGVYLITGGLGRIGFVLAQHLAQAVQARLVLLDRATLPERQDWDSWLAAHADDNPVSRKIRQLQTLEGYGAVTLVVQADVVDRAQMARAVQQALHCFGALHGVVHAAGLVGEDTFKPIAELSPADWDQQFAPKAVGLQVLADVLNDFDLDFCLLQSSLAAILGGLGMAGYAAANLFMDAFAQRQAASAAGRFPWISVNWDGWNFEGADPDQGNTGIMRLAILPEEGVEAFRLALSLNRIGAAANRGESPYGHSAVVPQVVVSTADLPARLAQWVERAPTTGQRAMSPAAAPPNRSDGHARPNLRTAYMPPRSALEEEIVALWQEILGITPIGVFDDFFELGGHSLLATQIVSRLRDTYHVELPLRNLFETPTAAGLAELIEALRMATEGAEATSQPADGATPAIMRIPRDGELPLSYGQQRLWFLDQLEAGSPLYNNFAALRLTGRLDAHILERSLNQVIARHEILRTVFVERAGQPVQFILDHMPLALPVVDLSTLPTIEARQAEVLRLAAAEARQPFDLSVGPLLRAKLIRLAPSETSAAPGSVGETDDIPAHGETDDSVLCFTMHHIVSDGWSVGVLVQETIAIYNALVEGRPAALPALAFQYVDWAAWQRNWLSHVAEGQGQETSPLEQQLTYWRQQLADAPLLDLPTDRPRSAVQTSHGANAWFEMPAELHADLETLSQREGVTLFMTLLAGLQTLLYRYTGHTEFDISVGTPIANRTRAETEGLIGFLLNTLVMRTRFGEAAGAPSVRQLLARVREVALGAYANQDIPFEMLVEALQPQRDMSRSPLFQVMFDLQVAPLRALEGIATSITVQPLAIDPGTAKFDLALSMMVDPPTPTAAGRLYGYLNYNTDLFDPTTIQSMLEHFETLLANMVATPDAPIDQLPLLTSAERQQVVAVWNDTETGERETRTVAAMFEAQAARRPWAVALTMADADAKCSRDGVPSSNGADGSAPLTYGELNQRANRLAHHLIDHGVGPGVMVALQMERSPDMIAALLAVLKTGGAFVPLDPATPPERLAFILADTRAAMLLTDETIAALSAASVEDEACFDPSLCVSAEHTAYVIYTSGSTGTPKGVLISHGAIAQHLHDITRVFGLTSEDRVLQFAAYTFDQALEQILATLTVGAQLVMRGAEIWPAQDFPSVAEQYELTVINLPPAYWNQVVMAIADASDADAARPYAPRLIIAGGDALAAESVRLWQRSSWRAARFLNAYGPTETTITACIFEASSEYMSRQGPRSAPIGRPLPNRRAYVMDAHGQPAGIGIPGELYLGGAGLAVGYLNQPDLTAERFVPDPFAASSEQSLAIGGQSPFFANRALLTDHRLYRTGDLVRWLPDGNLEFLGRIDQQVKIRGFRIELGEIEATLVQHPAIQTAVVVARDDAQPDGAASSIPPVESSARWQGDSKRLVAYIVPRKASPDEQKALTPANLRSYVESKLPAYMTPSAFVLMDSLPLTASGKVNRRRLPAPDYGQLRPEQAYAGPRTPIEAELAAIWGEVLRVQRIGVHDNFFDLGGHSLLATQILSRVRHSYPVDIPLRKLFETPTVAGLAAAIEYSLLAQENADKLASLLAELEAMSDEEASRLLAG